MHFYLTFFLSSPTRFPSFSLLFYLFFPHPTPSPPLFLSLSTYFSLSRSLSHYLVIYLSVSLLYIQSIFISLLFSISLSLSHTHKTSYFPDLAEYFDPVPRCPLARPPLGADQGHGRKVPRGHRQGPQRVSARGTHFLIGVSPVKTMNQ